MPLIGLLFVWLDASAFRFFRLLIFKYHGDFATFASPLRITDIDSVNANAGARATGMMLLLALRLIAAMVVPIQPLMVMIVM